MGMEDRLKRVLETIQSQSRSKLQPLGQCPGCNALFPSCVGMLAAWEHVNNWKESHSQARGRIMLAALRKEAEVGSEEQLAVLTALGRIGFSSGRRCGK